jgi:hypothetical protein
LSFKILLGLLLMYFIINFTLVVPKLKNRKFAFYFYAPILIFLMHISWGAGFISGFILPKSNKL